MSKHDRDGDGIPNRKDPDRDGDGIPNRKDPHPNRPDHPTPTPTPTPTGKGQINFAEDIGQIARDPVSEVVHMVKVRRDNVSTHAEAPAGVVVSGLPEGVVQVEPATFKAGSQYAEVPFRFAPSGAPAPALAAAPPLTGRADVVASDVLAPGANASKQFTVVDGPAVPPQPKPPADKWWVVPGGNLSGNAWNIGVNSTGWNKTEVDRYAKEVGRRVDTFCAANHHGAVISGTDWSSFHSQAFFNNSSGFGALLQCKVKDKTLHVLNFYTHPVGVPLQEIADGKHDAEYVKFGQDLRVSVGQAGLSDWQLFLRTNKEGNQDAYLTSQGQGHVYGLAVGRAIKGIRQGYGTTSRGRLRFTFSPARGLVVGPLKGFCSFDSDGSCLYDAVSVSTHPANQLNGEAGRPFDEQVAAAQKWLEGGYKAGYSYLNTNKDYSVKALVDEYGLAFSADEWGCRFEPGMYCAISAAATHAIRLFFASVQDRLAWDCHFQSNILDEQDICPGWAANSRQYKKDWGV